LSITTSTGSAGATLSCTTNPINASSGVATFAGCKINQAGTNFTLTATRSGLTSGTSGQFDVLGVLTISTVVRDGGNKKVHFTGTGAEDATQVTVTICAVNSFPCASPVTTSNDVDGGDSTGAFVTAQSLGGNLPTSQTYFAQAVQGSRTSAVFTFSTTGL
jgi:hypothetical protein